MFGKKNTDTAAPPKKKPLPPKPEVAAKDKPPQAAPPKPAETKKPEPKKPEAKKSEAKKPEAPAMKVPAISAEAHSAAKSAETTEKKSELEDPFSGTLHNESQVSAGDGDSITSLRLQRARNRIWLDLRDGIDLKALARMNGKAARDEVYSAVEEIARFRNLDLTPAELQSIAKECADWLRRKARFMNTTMIVTLLGVSAIPMRLRHAAAKRSGAIVR